ncbi:terminase large subunit [Companilactobacillus allii]|uniref:Terminase n=1 Tax=Companilactobacillus allii TaxID=1847728 RepID=A0A1P8Q5K3_9LACO|nr:terminase TerL endonuclease subunit [Companilactobacillus allii]APX73121.1 terminase [Companilactobacillus allii]USQ67922.1 terminase large subunit [Companilactobacillus allii]
MIKYPDDYDPILEYWNTFKQNGGKNVVSQKIYLTYKHLVWKLKHDEQDFYYSNFRGNHVIEFIENYCRHSKGKMGGKKIVLELWEKAMLAAIFGFIDSNGNRQYQRATLIIGKKNGKSLLGSAVSLYLQVADGEPGPEVYAVATKKDQAKIIWNEAKSMVRKSPDLRKIIKPKIAELDSVNFNDGVFKPLSADSDTLDGLNVHGVLMDEIHQWKNGEALYNIMADGITAREEPLIFITSTAGTVREDIYDQIYDEGVQTVNGYEQDDGYKDYRSIFFIYELDNRNEWTVPAMWKKANPGLGTIKNKTTLAEKVERAKHNHSLIKNLVCKEFNIRETSTEAWLNFEDLNNEKTFDISELKPRYGIGGIDLSATTDLTCATAIFQVPNDPHIYVKQMYWIPENSFERHIVEDKIPYDKWKDRGLIRLSQGNKVNYHEITEWFKDLQDKDDIYLYKIGYDSWSAAYLIDELNNEFGRGVTEPVIQGKKTLSSPMQSMGADLKSKLIVYNNNPILKWCLSNTSVDIDKNNNIQPAKGKSKTKRIDGVASLLDAYTIRDEYLDDYNSVI